MKRPTILDVARRAGVSKSTVSLVLQDSPQVRDATRKVVEQSIKEIGYVYNRTAANLRGGVPGLIGLVVNDLRNPYFTEFATSAQMRFAEEGFATVIANTDENPEMQTQVVHSIIEHGAAAILISPTFGGDCGAFERIARAGTPAMQLMRHVDPRTDLFPFFSFENREGGALATAHLLEMGCRRIAFVGGDEKNPAARERMAGYRDVMASNGLESMLLTGPASRSFGRDAAHDLLAERADVDGAVCFSDRVALGVHASCAELGVELGRDFRLVGFDDLQECSIVHPRLSSVRCDTARFGRDAADAILAWIREGERPPPVKLMPVALAPRRSSLGP